MYEELIERLRTHAKSYEDMFGKGESSVMMQEAAKAIEEFIEDNAALRETVANLLEQIKELSKPLWIPITSRPMTKDERREYTERAGFDLADDEAVIYTCPLPDDRQKVLVSYTYNNEVGIDTFGDDSEYGCYFEENGDMDGIAAWMPLPEPYKREEQ